MEVEVGVVKIRQRVLYNNLCLAKHEHNIYEFLKDTKQAKFNSCNSSQAKFSTWKNP